MSINNNKPLMDDQPEAEGIAIADAFFSVYEELNNIFSEYGFDKKSNQIIFNHETIPCVYFRVSEPIDCNLQNETHADYFIGVLMPPGAVRYLIDSIHVIVYRDVGADNKSISVPIYSEKHVDPPFPSKAEIFNRIHQLIPETQAASKRRIEAIRERFGLNSKTNEAPRDQGIFRKRSI